MMILVFLALTQDAVSSSTSNSSSNTTTDANVLKKTQQPSITTANGNLVLTTNTAGADVVVSRAGEDDFGLGDLRADVDALTALTTADTGRLEREIERVEQAARTELQFETRALQAELQRVATEARKGDEGVRTYVDTRDKAASNDRAAIRRETVKQSKYSQDMAALSSTMATKQLVAESVPKNVFTRSGLIKLKEDQTLKCDANSLGGLRLSPGGHKLEVCKNVKMGWEAIGMEGIGADLYGTKDYPATSCNDIKKNNPGASSGLYNVFLEDGKVHKVYCDQKTQGGGWLLLHTHINPKGMFGGSRHPLKHNYNPDSPDPTKGYSRDWGSLKNPKKGSEVMVAKTKGGADQRVAVVDHFCGWDSRDKHVCTGCHGTYARVRVRQPNSNSFYSGTSWLNSCSNCGGCNSHGCDAIGLNINHADYSAFYGGSQQLYGTGWNGRSCYMFWAKSRVESYPFTVWHREPSSRDPTLAMRMQGAIAGSSKATPATSCQSIKTSAPAAPTGKYWVRDGRNEVIPVWCEMQEKGGGWMLLITSTHPNNMISGSRHPLGSVNINADNPGPSHSYTRDWRGRATPKTGTEFLMVNMEGASVRAKITQPNSFCGWGSTSNGVCSGCHGTYARITIYQENGAVVPGCPGNCWLNSCSNCGGCRSRGCDSIGFNANHADYAAYYGGSHRLWGSGWMGSQCVTHWDRSRYMNNAYGPLKLYMRHM